VKTVKRARAKYLWVAALYVASMASFFSIPVSVQADSELAYSGGPATGLVEDYIPLSGITITSDEPTIPVKISAPHGELSMTVTTGLTFSSDPTGRSLSFTGSRSDVSAALATLRYRTITAGPVQIDISLTTEDEVYFPGNGHLYSIINVPGGITHDDAVIAAEGLTRYGVPGYLATVTSQEENDYLVGRLSGDGWFGASDKTTEGDWQWSTGPEAGTSFWSGLGANVDGQPVDGLFSNWASGEPNDSGGDEDCAQFYSSGSGWNDLPCSYPYLSYYVVEFGTSGNLPQVEQISIPVTVNIPSVDTFEIDSCVDLVNGFSVEKDTRYDTLSLTQDIDCTGEDVQPLFSEDDPTFGVIGFRGTFDGQGFAINNLTVNSSDDSAAGLFGYVNGGVITDTVLDVNISGVECVGGLAGVSMGATISEVTISGSVNGDYRVGGLVGCERGSSTAASLIEDNIVSADVSAEYSAGGIIGIISNESDETGAEITVQANEFNGELIGVDENYAMGGIIGQLYAYSDAEVSINNNTLSSEISLPTYDYVGGVVGLVNAYDVSSTLIFENNVNGAVSAYNTAGGVAGAVYSDYEAQLTIRDSTTTQAVSVEDSKVGGIVGELGGYSVIRNSSSSALVTGTDGDVGGLVGNNYGDARIIESVATGLVNGGTTQGNGTGGLVGRNSGMIERSYATGTVQGYSRVGGLAGANGGDIFDSYARGNVSGNDNVGGFAGRCGDNLTRVYSTGTVTSVEPSFGGLLGVNGQGDCDLNGGYWDVETSGVDSSVLGEGKTTAQMQRQSTFASLDDDDNPVLWNFISVWGISPGVNDGYPCLRAFDVACATIGDEDADGIQTSVENAAPNSGDANNDGILDSLQSNVSSLPGNNGGNYVAVVVDQSCVLQDVRVTAETSHTSADPGYQYQEGFVNFAADCGTPGYETTVTLYFYGAAISDAVVRKYLPTQNAYLTVSAATRTAETIGGQAVVVASYQVTDGGSLDIDGQENGIIVDPVGLGVLVTGAPNTGVVSSQPQYRMFVL